MTIDEFIKELESKAELEKERAFYDAVKWNCITAYGAYCRKLESEYRQLAEWLKDYQRILEEQHFDDAKKHFDAIYKLAQTTGMTYSFVEASIKEIEEALVEAEQKVGCWFIDERPESNREIICSNCEQPIFKFHKLDFDYRPKYCPNCGAKMKEDKE